MPRPPSTTWRRRSSSRSSGCGPPCSLPRRTAGMWTSGQPVPTAERPWCVGRRGGSGWCCRAMRHSIWTAPTWSAPPVARGFSPLDDRLGLLSCGYSPVLVEAMVRLGTRLPFAVVAEEMGRLFRVSVSADTVRRLTEEAGGVLARIEQTELEDLEHDAPEEVAGPAMQQVSADGCMLSLTDGRWTEVRTIAIGEITEQDGEPAVQDITYFSRHGSADAFIRQTTLPTHERGTRRATTVAAVMDGAS